LLIFICHRTNVAGRTCGESPGTHVENDYALARE
jgi:hypothetical protein